MDPQRVNKPLVSNAPAPNATQSKKTIERKTTVDSQEKPTAIPKKPFQKSVEEPALNSSKSSLSKYSNLGKISPENATKQEYKPTATKKADLKPQTANVPVEDQNSNQTSQGSLSKYSILTKPSAARKPDNQRSGTTSKESPLNDAKKSNEAPVKSKLSLSAIKEQKRNEIKKLNESLNNDFADSLVIPTHKNPFGISAPNCKSLETIIENARKSGQLNLSDHNLNEGRK